MRGGGEKEVKKIDRQHLRGRYPLAAALLAAALLAAACGGGSASSGGQPSTSVAGSQSRSGPAATAQPEPANTATPGKQEAAGPADGGTATPKSQGRSVAEIKAGVSSSKFLDGRHIAAGLTCEGCHGALPAEGAPKPPDSEKCLSCHGGNRDALAAKTAALGTRNPHNPHEGPLECSKCHGVHKPFEYYCNTCHTFSVPKRFQS